MSLFNSYSIHSKYKIPQVTKLHIRNTITFVVSRSTYKLLCKKNFPRLFLDFLQKSNKFPLTSYFCNRLYCTLFDTYIHIHPRPLYIENESSKAFFFQPILLQRSRDDTRRMETANKPDSLMPRDRRQLYRADASRFRGSTVRYRRGTDEKLKTGYTGIKYASLWLSFVTPICIYIYMYGCMYVYLSPADKFAVTTRNNVYSRDFIRGPSLYREC